MDTIKLIPIGENDKEQFITDIQEAFQKGYEEEYGALEETVLPRKDIESSFHTIGARAYFAVVGNDVVGGTIIVINEETNCNHLDLLYVKNGCQNKGMGQAIWKAVEELYPNTKIWETYTPYFEKRNIHFYVNKCGFHIVEFYNQKHKDPHSKGDTVGGMPVEVGENFFRFKKVMK